jgi:hypothetical protein
MAFGLAGAPATYSKMMDATLMVLRDVECLVHLDILIFSATIPERARRMRLVFERTREANFKLGKAKCTFAAPKVSYLGNILSKCCDSPDQSKVTAIWNFPRPKTVRDVRAFWGLSGYYRNFIEEYAAISRPMTQPTKKDAKCEWSEAQQLVTDDRATEWMQQGRGQTRVDAAGQRQTRVDAAGQRTNSRLSKRMEPDTLGRTHKHSFQMRLGKTLQRM